MTPAEFIAKWQASTRNERAACQEHFIDLCRLLDELTPNADPTGEDGWADVWRHSCFAWEYKKKRGDLDAWEPGPRLRPPPMAGQPICPTTKSSAACWN